MVDALHAGTDSPQSPSIEPAPKDSRAPVTERVENSLEIPETPEITLEKIQHEEDSHSEDVIHFLIYMDAGRPRLTELRSGAPQWKHSNCSRHLDGCRSHRRRLEAERGG